MKFLSFVIAFGCALLAGCASVKPLPADHHVDLLSDETVVLADVDTNKAFCAGVWVDDDKVLTAHHCIDENPIVRVTDRIGGSSVAVVLAKDELHDLALLEVTEAPVVHAVAAVALAQPRAGDPVEIVGHPSGFVWAYTQGIVSAIRTTEELAQMFPNDKAAAGPWLHVAAPVWFGNSGGGVFNSSHELVGICSFKTKMPGFGFFVSVPTIRAFLKAYSS